MKTKNRYQHCISLNQEQEESLEKARSISNISIVRMLMKTVNKIISDEK